MSRFFVTFIFLVLSTTLGGSEKSYLSNIRQLTFPEMGFVKAGEAYFSPDESMIIFQAVPEGKTHYQMYLMRLDEKKPWMVSTGKGACTCGYFHPNGNSVIFASSHDSPLPLKEPDQSSGKYEWELTPYMNIYRANLDGSSLVPLTDGPAYHAECAYSPGGSRIVYASNEDGSMNLYIMSSDGSNKRQLTFTTGCYNGGCFFSPEGKRVIFRADRDTPHYLQIYSIDIDGTNEQQLTDNDAVNWAPYWHPDGRHVAYTRTVDHHGKYELFLLDILTGKERRITYSESFDGLPVFNHDGTKLMWTSKRGPDGTCQIFIADFTLRGI